VLTRRSSPVESGCTWKVEVRPRALVMT
jgi:hypothetical protein